MYFDGLVLPQNLRLWENEDLKFETSMSSCTWKAAQSTSSTKKRNELYVPRCPLSGEDEMVNRTRGPWSEKETGAWVSTQEEPNNKRPRENEAESDGGRVHGNLGEKPVEEKEYTGDEEWDDDGETSGSAPGASQCQGPLKRRKRELHRRHSKRYRENLGELFSELERILPQVMPGSKMKTKSQIIATSVNAVLTLKTKIATLEMRYIQSSRENRTRWVKELVAEAQSFPDAVEPFMRLMCRVAGWKFCELWTRHISLERDQPADKMRLKRTVSIYDDEKARMPADLLEFCKHSRNMVAVQGDRSLVGHISASLRAQCFRLIPPGAFSGFHRAKLALKAGFVQYFALPILLRGHVAAVVIFFETEQRDDIKQNMGLAQDLASAIGNCYGAWKPLPLEIDREKYLP